MPGVALPPGNAGKGLPEGRLPIRVEVTGVPLRLAKVTTGVTPVEEGGGAAVRCVFFDDPVVHVCPLAHACGCGVSRASVS